MDSENRNLLDDVIELGLQDIKKLEAGSRERSSAVEDVAKLYKLRLDEIENERALREQSDKDYLQEQELKLKAAQFEDELKLKNAQLEEQTKQRYFSFAVGMAGIILTPVIYHGCNKGLAKILCMFEKDYTWTSSAGKALSKSGFRFWK